MKLRQAKKIIGDVLDDCLSCIFHNTNGTCGNTRSIMFGVATNSGEPQLCNDIVTTQEKHLRRQKENVKYKAFMIMNKIKEKLIHWLGGVTKEEHNKWLEYKESHGKYYATEFLLSEAKRLYGLPADQ